MIGVDLATDHAETLLDRADPAWREQITLIEGDLRDPATIKAIEAEIDPLARPLVVEDAAHTGEVTTAALESLAHLVPAGGFFVVEDGHVDIERLHPDGPPMIRQIGERSGGVIPARRRLAGDAGGQRVQPARGPRALRSDEPPERLPAAPPSAGLRRRVDVVRPGAGSAS